MTSTPMRTASAARSSGVASTVKRVPAPMRAMANGRCISGAAAGTALSTESVVTCPTPPRAACGRAACARAASASRKCTFAPRQCTDLLAGQPAVLGQCCASQRFGTTRPGRGRATRYGRESGRKCRRNRRPTRCLVGHGAAVKRLPHRAYPPPHRHLAHADLAQREIYVGEHRVEHRLRQKLGRVRPGCAGDGSTGRRTGPPGRTGRPACRARPRRSK